MKQKTRNYTQKDGRRLFEEDRARRMSDPKFRAIYDEEAKKKELWLQLAEARQAAGLTQLGPSSWRWLARRHHST